MNNERFLVFDIDDTLYSQMEPLLTACEFSLGRKLPDPELFYRIFGKRSAEMFLFSESGQVSIFSCCPVYCLCQFRWKLRTDSLVHRIAWVCK